MDQHQQELRRAATEAFFESLDKLQEALSIDDPIQAPPKTAAIEPSIESPEISLASLEQAVADIEEFMQSKDQ